MIYLAGLASCAKYSTEPGYLGLLLLGGSGGGSASSFWANTSFTYRQKIVFGTSHDALSTNYTSMFTLDTQTASGFVALASADDVRIYFQQSDGTATQLDRIIWNPNTANSQIDFKMAATLSANQNEPASDSYYVYYGNASAGTPPATESNVYYFADFFNRADSTTINGGWTEWLVGIANPEIVSGRISIPGNNGAMEAGIKQSFSALSQDFVTEWDWFLAGNSEDHWSYYVNIGDSATIVDNNITTGVGPGIYFGEGVGAATYNPNVALYNMDFDLNKSAAQIENNFLPAVDLQPLTSYSFKIVVDVSASTYSYSRDGGAISNHAFYNAGTTLDLIRLGTSDYATGNIAMGYDNVRIYLKAADDPEVSLEGRETN